MKSVKDSKGFTLIEIIVTMAILAILASMILPLSEVTVKRTKELQLKRSLQMIRDAIDQYKEDYDHAVEEKKIIRNIDDSGYPKELSNLVHGVDWGGLYPYKMKYLRRIPEDPFDKDDQGWGLRSYRDESDTTVWGGEDVYDVFSQSDGTALDGSDYRDW